MMFHFTLFLLMSHTYCSYGFNIDIDTKTTYQMAKHTMFGHSIDLYSSGPYQYLLVGAPKAQSGQPNVETAGLIYKCDVSTDSCTKINVDPLGDAPNPAMGTTIERKSHQMFGATLTTDKNSERILACAPHYTYRYESAKYLDPVGSCYLAENLWGSWQRFVPCNDSTNRKTTNYGQYGAAMCGFSVSLPKQQNQIFFGGPGARHSQGIAIVQDTMRSYITARTKKGASWTDDHNLGYAVSSISFGGQEDVLIAGAPRAGNQTGNFTGKVSLFTSKLDVLYPILDIFGEQSGSYFGAAIAALDVNGDGMDDLVIGAPFYSQFDRSLNSMRTKYDVGRVTVYCQTHTGEFVNHADINGDEEWSRFGHSITAAGDLNLDGAQDFIVGAPYAGIDGSGAVYVFNGKKGSFDFGGGVYTKPSQKITSKNVDKRITSFGWSLAGNKDIDKNDYDDIAVGAVQSSKVFLLKSRPIITINGSISVTPNSVDLIHCKNTHLKLKLHLILVSESKGNDRKHQETQVKCVFNLDTKHHGADARVTNERYGKQWNTSLDLQAGVVNDSTYTLFVSSNATDKLSPINIEVAIELVPSSVPSGIPKPILDIYGSSKFMTTIEIDKNCGLDKKCIPDLSIVDLIFRPCRTGAEGLISCNERNKFYKGEDEYMRIIVKVVNKKESAYLAKLALNFTEGWEFAQFEKFQNGLSLSLSYDVVNANKVICDLGNPLPKGVALELTFDLRLIDFQIQETVITAEVSTTNPEPLNTLADNQKNLTIPLDIDPKVRLLSNPDPELIEFSSSDYRQDIIMVSDIGPLVKHIYEIRNDGPINMTSAVLNIFWPSETKDGNHLLYLSREVEITTGVGNCNSMQRLNPDNLALPTRSGQSGRQNNEKQKNNAQMPKLKKPHSSKGIMNKDCSIHNCAHIKCRLGLIVSGAHAVITIYSNLYVNTLIKQHIMEADITSMVKAEAKSSAYNLQTSVNITATTKVVWPVVPIPHMTRVPWWAWLISGLAGLLLLLLLVLLLWKLGFFKRKRPQEQTAKLKKAPEGDYHGVPTRETWI